MNPKVDIFLEKAEHWQAEMRQLRQILLGCGLDETLKWRQPCYTYQEANIGLIGAFKDSVVLSFFKGVLLQDSAGLLVKPGENSQAARIFRFTELAEIVALKTTIEAYIYEAIEVEKAGLVVDFSANKTLDFPEELIQKMDADPVFKIAFESLTIGRQRGYNLYFSAAKQAKSRLARIEKYQQRILDGYGFHDCVCGLSKKMPGCDGSHKTLENK